MPFGPTAPGGVQDQPHQLDVETRQQLEQALNDWGNVDSVIARRVDELIQQWNNAAQPLVEAISESERLTQDDFAIRINARD